MCGCPEPTGVIFDDGPADGEPHSQSARLRRVERGKRGLDGLGRETSTRVAHRYLYSQLFAALRADDEVASSVLHRRHRVNGVQDEIEQDLLELDSVPENVRQLR